MLTFCTLLVWSRHRHMMVMVSAAIKCFGDYPVWEEPVPPWGLRVFGFLQKPGFILSIAPMKMVVRHPTNPNMDMLEQAIWTLTFIKVMPFCEISVLVKFILYNHYYFICILSAFNTFAKIKPSTALHTCALITELQTTNNVKSILFYKKVIGITPV